MVTEMEITRETAAKVLEVVDAGLVSGVGNPVPGQMCVEAAVCYAMGLPHGDDPYTVSTILRALKIRLNDSTWSSARSRATGLRRLAVAQLGSQGVLDDAEFGRRVVELAIRKQVPIALRAAAKIHPSRKQRAKLLAAAATCERQGTRQAVPTPPPTPPLTRLPTRPLTWLPTPPTPPTLARPMAISITPPTLPRLPPTCRTTGS